ncbi:CYFA0S04e05710g1_1 [Cyberlindnera fabianii]|uniref:CYFA0S04e05710g1_1 n=1 Tax=Cyberlindnera fabianii TaxID=36022 RepID=A0A061AZM1_CYBFA|nr:Cruciform cutting endonuclease 1, mitochondrial [Cyberlindnera fabianii]CDR40198.1 CYFA0S04e05710g1_1 [Cyberlindnera fabianii]
MGIRNFAFTKAELDKRLPFNTPLLVKEWTKFDVNDWAGNPQTNNFEPLEYAKLSTRLVEEVLLPKDEPLPDAILIERQRARSAGSSSVLEYVLRVNMFEAMLHALIYNRTVAEKGRVGIVSTIPSRMANYWKPEGEEKFTMSDTKKHRMNLVEQWLNDTMYAKKGVRQMVRLDEQRFKLSKEVAATSKAQFTWTKQVMEQESRYVKQAGDGGKPKIDDLVDSLLHAVSWMEWEQNRMLLKLEMLSGLDTALATSDKMFDSHMKSIEFLKRGQKGQKRKKTHDTIDESMEKASQTVGRVLLRA